MQSRSQCEKAADGAQHAAVADKWAKQIMDMARILPVSCDEYMYASSHCDTRLSGPRPVIRMAMCWAVAPLVLMFAFALTALAAELATEPTPAAPAGAPIADAAASCARTATQKQHVNLSSGVYTEQAVASAPLSLELSTGIDQAQYGECLRRAGFDEHAATAAYVERADACRAAHTPRVQLAREGERARLAGGLDEAGYRACLADEIAVEATLPE